VPPTSSPEVIEKLKHAPGVAGVEGLIHRRWSPRAYSDKEVTAEELKKLFEAARWAASSSNEQPWRFLVGRRGDETYQKIFNALVEFNQAWAKSAPVLVLSVAKMTFTAKGTANRFGLHDTGAAMANLALQATADGLHTHSMAGFDNEQMRASFAIPSDYELGAVTAIGYFGDPASLPEHLHKQEVSPRQRKPLEEFVFSAWEKPVHF
jgi:nitroreductase